MFFYLIFAKPLLADRWLVSGRKCSAVLYASEAAMIESTPIYARHLKNKVAKMHSPSPSAKLTIGIRLYLKTQVAVMFLLLANDIETQPGPATLAEKYDEMPTVRGFKVGHLNIRSVRNKTDDLRLLLEQNSFDVLTLSESWLENSVHDCEVSIPGYDVLRQDRGQNKRGGGTMMYIRNGVPFRHREDIATTYIESCWIEICKPKAKTMLIGCVYRAPDALLDCSIEELEKSLLNVSTNYEILLTGDFNVNFLASNKAAQSAGPRRKLKNFAISADLEQLITTVEPR